MKRTTNKLMLAASILAAAGSARARTTTADYGTTPDFKTRTTPDFKSLNALPPLSLQARPLIEGSLFATPFAGWFALLAAYACVGGALPGLAPPLLGRP
jgi:hypothetical protein